MNNENTPKNSETRRVDVLVIGGGQAGLAVSYQLKKRGVEHLVLDASRHIGDAWRQRWDSLRLFTPAAFDGLDGMKFPAPSGSYPTKDEMADYLRDYATKFTLPVVSNSRVESLTRDGDDFVAVCDSETIVAAQVVVAMSNYQEPERPFFAFELGAGIPQLDALSYRNPEQLPAGPVLIVGVGNSGTEIAKDLVSTHPVLIAGKVHGELPFPQSHVITQRVMLPMMFKLIFPKVLSVTTPMGRRARQGALKGHAPLIRVRSSDLDTLGIQRVGRIVGVRGGLPVAEDGSTLDVNSVIWCTGFTPGFDWIKVPAFDETGEPLHERGVVASIPGLYFVGLHFLSAMSSAMVNGVSRDAARIADHVANASREEKLLRIETSEREPAATK